MTESLKQAIEKYAFCKSIDHAKNERDNGNAQVSFIEGFQECLSLMLPLVEKLEYISSDENWNTPVSIQAEARGVIKWLAEKVQNG